MEIVDGPVVPGPSSSSDVQTPTCAGKLQRMVARSLLIIDDGREQSTKTSSSMSAYSTTTSPVGLHPNPKAINHSDAAHSKRFGHTAPVLTNSAAAASAFAVVDSIVTRGRLVARVQ